MPDTIRDGTGQGNLARVDSENRLHTFSDTLELGLYVSLTKGEMFSNILSVTPAGAANCFLYISNTRPGYDMVIGKVTILTPNAEMVDVLKVTGTPVGGTAFTPANRNLNYTNNALGVFQYGTNITGLTASPDILSRFYSASNVPVMYDVYDGIVIPSNTAVGFFAKNGAIKVDYSVVWYYFKSAVVV
jgi:hypothetical protein